MDGNPYEAPEPCEPVVTTSWRLRLAHSRPSWLAVNGIILATVWCERWLIDGPKWLAITGYAVNTLSLMLVWCLWVTELTTRKTK